MSKEFIEVKIPILDSVDEMKVVETFNQEQLWYVCAIAKAFEKSEQENKQLKNEIRKYQKDRDTNTKRHLEVQDYIKSRIQYCKEMTGFDCCIEELQEISKMV